MSVTPSIYPLVYCTVLHCGINPDGNARSLLRETLDSLLKMTYSNFRIVVVDNGSTDGSQAMLHSEYPIVELVENGRNLGVMEGYNIGLRYGLTHSAAWVMLLNNDIVVDPDLLSTMMDVGLSNERIGIVGPKIYYHNDPDTFWYAGGRINYFTGIIAHRGLRQRDRGQYDRVEDTDYVNGCAMLIRREVIEQIGMLDLVFSPMYSEDADYSIRAHRAGYRLVYVPQAKLWHKVSAFSGGGLTPLKTALKVEHNLIVFKRYARWYHWLTIPWSVGAVTIVFVLKELFHGNFKIIDALVRGFGKAIGRLVMKERESNGC
ncbi:MAG: glycosyltransferase family 2 protein [Ignavibacteriae bacterium]|nr:glycosyltransferase family 2 protein [Ignavibacteria bacterium]MBI3365131.1 glycosyltransferase family 2 protein [Ignavibacteriota bacterium]